MSELARPTGCLNVMVHSALDPALVAELHRAAGAERWELSENDLAEALQAIVARAFGDRTPERRELERYLRSLHLEDLALGCACAAGHEGAWDHFMREQRPVLYRAADAIDPGGSARELADALYADLYGLAERDGRRQSLLRHFHGRSSLATWLRAVLAQRHVDRLRAARHLEPLGDQDAGAAPAADVADPERSRWLALVEQALGRAISRLDARDRLRLGCYYAQGLTLAQVGRLLGEHEATVSRHLARVRQTIRQDVERQLRQEAGLDEAAIAQCFDSVTEDPGGIDLKIVLGREHQSQEAGS